MNRARLNLLVLRSPQLEAAKAFFEAIGLSFVAEKHGRGPDHDAATLGALVLELYPSGKEVDAGDLRLGFDVPVLEEVVAPLIGLGVDVPDLAGRSVVVKDPDGRLVELRQAAG